MKLLKGFLDAVLLSIILIVGYVFGLEYDNDD